MTKLVHDAGGLVVVDHSAAAPYRLMDINEIDADVVAVNAVGWGGPPIGALAFREPAMIDTFASMSLTPNATGPGRLETGVHQFGLLAGVVASVEYLAGLDESASGTRRQRLAISMQSASLYMDRVFDYLLVSLRSLPRVMVLGRPEVRIPVVSFAVTGVPAERVVQRLADNGVCAIANAPSRVLDLIGVNDVGGAVSLGLAHYSTTVRGGPVGPRARVARLTPTRLTRRTTLPVTSPDASSLVRLRRLLDREHRPDHRPHSPVGDHRPHVPDDLGDDGALAGADRRPPGRAARWR